MKRMLLCAIAVIFTCLVYFGTPRLESLVNDHIARVMKGTVYSHYVEYFIVCDGQQYQVIISLSDLESPTCDNLDQYTPSSVKSASR